MRSTKTWGRFDQMDRGVPGELVPAHSEDAEEDLFPARDVSLDSDGFPLSAPPATEHSGLSQPEGPDLGPWREEEGVLRNGEILSGTRQRGSNLE